MKSRTSLLFALACLVAIPVSAQTTVPANSCAAADVQAAVNSAANGDIVTIPGGKCIWSTTVTKPNTKGITIAGAGQGVTVITVSATMGGNRRAFDLYVEPGNALTRLTGLSIDHGLIDCGTFCSPVAVIGEGLDVYRIDHVDLIGIGRASAGVLQVHNASGIEYPDGAELSGLIDSNVIACAQTVNTSCHPIAIVASPPWDGPSSLATNLSWGHGRAHSRPAVYGSNTCTYVENNIFEMGGFYHDGVTDTFGGARLCFRFSLVKGSALGGHGFDSAGYRSAVLFEGYRSVFLLGAAGPNCGFSRGGAWLFFDNRCTHPDSPKPVAFSTYRARPETFAPLFGKCDGSSPFDGNLGSGTNLQVAYPSIGTGQNPGWPCMDQQGWHFDEDGGAGFVPMRAYQFNNSDGAGGQVGISNYEGGAGNLQNYITCNREYFVGNATFTGAATVGNCATGGVGRGPRSSRPATCTTGVAWWSTDQGSWNRPGVDGPQDADDANGVLDICTATNTWTNAAYVPYPYPHPLARGTAAPAPTPTPTPTPTPRPAPSVCVSDPLRVTNVSWPTNNTGRRSITLNSSHPRADVRWTWTATKQTLTVTDTRGCSVTLTR